MNGQRVRKLETFARLGFLPGSGPPTGVEAAEGTLYWDSTNKDLYINTNGGTTWSNFGGGAADSTYLRLDTTNDPLTGPLTITTNSNDALRVEDASNNPLFVVDPGGNVGVGTATPSHALQVSGGNVFIDNNQYYYLGSTSVRMYNNGSGQLLWEANGSMVFSADWDGSGAGIMLFRTKAVSRMVLDNSGNLSLGHTSPECILDVENDGKFAVMSETSVSGTAVTMLSAGAVSAIGQFVYVVEDSLSNTNSGTVGVAVSGSTNIFDDGGPNTLQLSVTAGGAVQVQRTAGSRTYDVNLVMVSI